MRKKLSSMLLAVMCCLFFVISCGGGGGGPDVVKVLPTPHIGVSSTTVAFGNVVWGEIAEQTISLQNTGSSSSSLSIGQIAGANPLVAPFSIQDDNCSGRLLAASQTCSFQVRFAPTNEGSGLADTFNIPSNDPGQLSVTVNVSGNGRGLRVFINEVTYSCPGIDLLMTVTDKDGIEQTGLLAGNFQLTENGVAITGFSITPITSPTPVSVALALDQSTSITPTDMSIIKAESKTFINQFTDPADEAAIIKFATSIELKQGFTTNKSLLNNAIDANYTGDRLETHLYDTLYYAIDLTDPRPNSRAVIMLSDGKDANYNDTLPGSVKTLAEVIARANEKGIPVFTIGLGNVDTGVMSQLANATGGQYFYAPTANNLNAIYGTIKNILTGKYTLTYTTQAQGSPITLDVVVTSGTQGEVIRQLTGCP